MNVPCSVVEDFSRETGEKRGRSSKRCKGSYDIDPLYLIW